MRFHEPSTLSTMNCNAPCMGYFYGQHWYHAVHTMCH